MKLRPSTRLTTLALTLALTGLTLGAAAGDGKSTVDPTGTWKVTVVSTNTQARPSEQTLKLKLSGGTLTGTLSYNAGHTVNGKAPVAELPITDAKLQGNGISFKFTHPPAVGNGPNANYSYQGRISGDTIKGTFETEWMEHTRTRGWEARRVKQ